MAGWVMRFIEAHGYLGIALLMLAENLFPPLPSELIMPFAAFQAARGELHWLPVVLSGAAGALAGAMPWYLAGRLLGLQRVLRFAERHGRWLTLSPAEVQRAEDWFVRRGAWVLVAGRLVPALRTVISLPAGVTQLPFWQFCLWTAAGSVLWCGVLTAAGYALESQYARIASVLNPASTAILLGLVGWYAWRVVRFRP